jgi:flavin reductase
VNILSRGQEPLIRHFSGRPIEGLDLKYDHIGDTPLLAHTHAAAAAKVIARYPCGDHSLFVGQIFSLRPPDGAAPIVLHVGRLAALQHLQEQAPGPILDFW